MEPLHPQFARMAEFETGPGQTILPEVHVVLQLVGDRFGRIIADPAMGLERPFDATFAKWLLHVASDLLHAFEQARCAYLCGDEISLLFGAGAAGFGRGGYRFAIRVAAQASVRMSLHVGRVVTFVPHVFQMPTDEWMARYFEWRQHGLTSYGIDRYCRAALAKSGLDEGAVRRVLVELSETEKHEVLVEHGVEFEAAPAWQRRGVLVTRAPDERAAGTLGNGSGGNGSQGNGADSGGGLVIDSSLPEGRLFAQVLRELASDLHN